MRLGPGHSEKRSVHQDVVARRQILIKARAKFEEGHHSTLADHSTGRRCDHSGENLQECCLAGAVGADDAENGPGLDPEDASRKAQNSRSLSRWTTAGGPQPLPQRALDGLFRLADKANTFLDLQQPDCPFRWVVSKAYLTHPRRRTVSPRQSSRAPGQAPCTALRRENGGLVR